MPKRIQRKRSKGWRMPSNTVYVGRPTKWGNPFNWVTIGSKAKAQLLYRKWLNNELSDSECKQYGVDREKGIEIAEMAKRELRGKDLTCWCSLDEPCHCEVLLEVGNK